MRCAPLLKFALIALSAATPLLVSAAPGKCERLIATGGADNPPFLWRDPQNPKRLIGANVDLLKEITNSLNLKLEVLYTGNAGKAFEEVRTGRMDLLMDAMPEVRAISQLDFVHPPIATLQTVAWVRTDVGFPYGGHQDLHDRPGAHAAGTLVDKALFRSLKSTSSLAEAIERLSSGKADYVLHERYSAVARLGALGMLENMLRLDPPVAERNMHFAVAHDSACNSAWLRGQLAVRMTELAASGVPEQLLTRNIERWQQQPVQSSKP